MTARPLAFALALALAAGVTADEPPKAPPEFASKDWKFAAKYPGKPKEQTQAGPFGTKVTMYAVETRDGVMGVAVAEMPIGDNEDDKTTQTRLDGARDGAVKNVGGKLKESKAVTIGKEKHPGREFTATITKPKEGQVRARIYLVGKRLYQVMVMGTDEYATSKEATAFLESFRLTE